MKDSENNFEVGVSLQNFEDESNVIKTSWLGFTVLTYWQGGVYKNESRQWCKDGI